MGNQRDKNLNKILLNRNNKIRIKIVFYLLFAFVSLVGVTGYYSFHLHDEITIVITGSLFLAFILASILFLIFRDLNDEISEKNLVEASLKVNKEKLRRRYRESKRSEELYHSILHTSADAVTIYDLDGKVQYVNPSFTRIFGWTLEEIEGKPIPYIPDFEKAEALARFRDIIKTGRQLQGFETRRLTKNGKTIEVDISGSRYNDHEGKPAGMFYIIRDKTEKRELEAQLAYAQKMQSIGTLAGGAAHNFNNLLTGIQGNTSLLLLDREPDDLEYDRLMNIQKLVENGSKLTYQLLGYAREGKYEVKPINLNKLVTETSSTFEATRKEIVIHHDLAEDLSGISVDQGLIEQTLLNLYVNAIDAMPKGGDLFLTTLNVTHKEMIGKSYKPRHGNYVLFSISDTGIGMDKETRKRIFEPFFTTKGLVNGTGLGLASAYGIIKGHGGYIDVISEKGHGATFNIYLPAIGRIIKEEDRMYSVIIRGNETVLFVDDEEQVLDVGKEMLKRIGYTVLPAKSGLEALEIYNSNNSNIDMVILDMIMPNMNGEETYDRLKEIDPDIRVLLSSGYNLDNQAIEILKRGCKGFIQKPFTLNALSSKIREVLETNQPFSIQ